MTPRRRRLALIALFFLTPAVVTVPFAFGVWLVRRARERNRVVREPSARVVDFTKVYQARRRASGEDWWNR